MGIIKNIFFTLLGMFIGVVIGFAMTRSAEKSALERNINVVSAYNAATDANLSYNILAVRTALQQGKRLSDITLHPASFPKANFSLLGPKFSLHCKHVDAQVFARFKKFLDFEKQAQQKIYAEQCDEQCANELIASLEAMRTELKKTDCALYACVRRLGGSLDAYSYDFASDAGFEAFCAKEYAQKDAPAQTEQPQPKENAMQDKNAQPAE